MTGYLYNELLASCHFYCTFIGANVTFFPMHIIGMLGMPRRIPDYPELYAYWNKISSIGSIISLIGVFLFMFVIYDSLVISRIKSSRNP